jgi:NIMA (never in mitosis gene a)-related kinase
MLELKLTISEDRVWKMISQFFIGLAVMNDKVVAHRDVKDGNIFIDKENNIVLGDYGCAKQTSFDSHWLQTPIVGTMFGVDTSC